MSKFSASFLLLALCSLYGCEKSESLIVRISNETDYDFIEPHVYLEAPSGRVYPDGWDGVELPNLLSGETIVVELPTTNEFGWGTPFPPTIYADHPETGSLYAWDGNWCGTGYRTSTVESGVYRCAITPIPEQVGEETFQFFRITSRD